MDDAAQLIGAVQLQLEQHTEAVPQGAGDLARAGGGTHQREAGQVDADALGAGALADHDIQRVVLQRRVEHLFHLPGQAVDLVDEEHVALLQIGQQGGKVAGLLDGRAAGDADLHPHLVGDDARQRRFAQARRAVEQDVIHRLAAALGRFQIDLQVLLDLVLTDVVFQMLGTEAVFLVVRRGQARLHHFCAIERGFVLHGLPPACHAPQGQLDDLFHGQGAVDLGDGQGGFALAVAQRHQRRNGLPGSLSGGRVGRSTGHVLQIDALHEALGHLVLQFQHDALGQFGADAGRGLEGLVVARRDGQRHPVRLHDAQDGKAHLGAHARHRRQQLEAGSAAPRWQSRTG